MRTRPTVVVIKRQLGNMKCEENILRPLSPRLIAGDSTLNEDDLANLIRDADAVLNSSVDINSHLIEQMDRCEIIACYDGGTVDTAAAAEKNIRVKTFQEHHTDGIAEHLLTLIVSLRKKVVALSSSGHKTNSLVTSPQQLHFLKGMTLGVFGNASIAQELSGATLGTGIEIWSCSQDKFSSNPQIKNVDLYNLIRKSDFLSVHAPLPLESPSKFKEREFRLMKPGSFFISASESALVDEKALALALADGQIAGAALNSSTVCSTALEKNPLLENDRVILSSCLPEDLKSAAQILRESAAHEVFRVLSKNSSWTGRETQAGSPATQTLPSPLRGHAELIEKPARPSNGAKVKKNTFTVAEYLVRYLEKMGVKQIFGVVGGSITPIYKAIDSSPIQDVLTKHEAGAAFMADGYARVSGQLGVCVSTTGPGATNLITGVASAFSDSIPILVMTGQVSTEHFGKGASQESSPESMDIVQMYKHFTRYSSSTQRPDKVPEIMRKAFTYALHGRTGPVHLAFPNDVLRGEIENAPDFWHAPATPPALFDRDAVKAAAVWLLQAENPVILAGHGCTLADACDEIRQLAESLGIPVATTPKAKGVLPEDNPLSLGVFGFSGSPLAEHYLLSDRVDVMLAVGTSFSEWGTLGWKKELMPSQALLHINIDPYDIGKNYPATVSLCGNAKTILKELLFEIQRQRNGQTPDLNKFSEQVRKIRSQIGVVRNPSAINSDAVPLKPQRLMADLRASLPSDAIVFVDGGANRSWATHYFQARGPKTFFSATGMASMGFGVAGAIGAKFAAPDRIIISIVGDGGFLMNGMEVSTAVAYNKQVIWVVMNDGQHGMIYHGCRMLGYPPISTQYPICDVAKIAEGMGARSLYIHKPGEINQKLIQDIVNNGRPTVLDVRIDPTEAPPIGSRVSSLKNSFTNMSEG